MKQMGIFLLAVALLVCCGCHRDAATDTVGDPRPVVTRNLDSAYTSHRGTLELRLDDQASATIRDSVYDACSGLPIDSALVRFSGDSSGTVLDIEKEGYWTERRRVPRAHGPQATTLLNVHLHPATACLCGTLKSMDTAVYTSGSGPTPSTPAPVGMKIEARFSCAGEVYPPLIETMIGADGNFHFDHLPACSVHVSLPTLTRRSDSSWVVADTTLDLTPHGCDTVSLHFPVSSTALDLPSAQGAWWRYVKSASPDGPWTDTATLSIGGPATMNDGRPATSWWLLEGRGAIGAFVVNDHDTLKLFLSLTDKSTNLICPNRFRVGFSREVPDCGGRTGILDCATVTLPSGETRVSYHLRAEWGNGCQYDGDIVELWLVPGVGIVRSRITMMILGFNWTSYARLIDYDGPK